MIGCVLDHFRRQPIGGMKLLIEKHPRLSVLVGDREKTNALEFDRVLVPVVGVFLRMDIIVETPLLENERTIGDNVFRFRPGGIALVNAAVLKDDVFRHRIPGVVLGDFQEVWGRAT